MNKLYWCKNIIEFLLNDYYTTNELLIIAPLLSNYENVEILVSRENFFKKRSKLIALKYKYSYLTHHMEETLEIINLLYDSKLIVLNEEMKWEVNMLNEEKENFKVLKIKKEFIKNLGEN